jgi:hypothetical protein
MLRLLFGFDDWHTSPLSERKYAVDIIDYCNKKERRATFIEIGCGLGDIIRSVDYDLKTGLDMDPKVLRVARMLKAKNKKNTRFCEFHFPETPLEKRIDTLLMVNWVHHIEPETLKNKITEFFINNLNAQGMILIDTVQDKAYRYNHKINLLTDRLNCKIDKIGAYPRQREVWAIHKMN